jgi:hypothetical protein
VRPGHNTLVNHPPMKTVMTVATGAMSFHCVCVETGLVVTIPEIRMHLDGYFLVHDLGTGELMRTFDLRSRITNVMQLLPCPGGSSVYVSAHELYVVNIVTGDVLQVPGVDEIMRVARNDTHLCVRTWKGAMTLYSFPLMRPVEAFRMTLPLASALSWWLSPRNEIVYRGMDTDRLVVCNTCTGDRVLSVRHCPNISDVVFDKAGEPLYVVVNSFWAARDTPGILRACDGIFVPVATDTSTYGCKVMGILPSGDLVACTRDTVLVFRDAPTGAVSA